MISLHRISAVVMRTIYESINSFEKNIDVFFWPVVDVLMWGLLTQFIGADSGFNWTTALLGAFILWTFMYAIQRDITMVLLTDVWERNLYNIFSAPLTPAEFVIGASITSILRTMVAMVLIVLMSIGLFGLEIIDNFGTLCYVFGNLLIFSIAFGCFASGIIFRLGQKMQSLAWAGLFVIQPLACVFYPLSTLPAWAQTIALAFPPTYVFEGVRTVMSGGTISDFNFWMPLGLGILYFIAFMSIFYWGYRDARKRGWLIQMD